MAKLILIKHSAPQVEPETPSDRWNLSEKGRTLCVPLAERLRAHEPTRIVSSIEPKAVQTSEELARHLGLVHVTAAGLHEHDRSKVPHLPSRDFISMMELFFRRPNERVLGRETAAQARQRITTAIDKVLADHPEESVAIVTHGTVLALYASDKVRQPAFHLWREMGLPSFLVLNVPGYDVIELVARVER